MEQAEYFIQVNICYDKMWTVKRDAGHGRGTWRPRGVEGSAGLMGRGELCPPPPSETLCDSTVLCDTGLAIKPGVSTLRAQLPQATLRFRWWIPFFWMSSPFWRASPRVSVHPPSVLTPPSPVCVCCSGSFCSCATWWGSQLTNFLGTWKHQTGKEDWARSNILQNS